MGLGLGLGIVDPLLYLGAPAHAPRPLASMRAAASALPKTSAVPRLASTLVGSPSAVTSSK